MKVRNRYDQLCRVRTSVNCYGSAQRGALERCAEYTPRAPSSRRWVLRMLLTVLPLASAHCTATGATAPTVRSPVAGLPLIMRPIDSNARTLVVMLSGDGGWSTLTEKVTDELNADGYPVVGWNMLKYFWRAKTPQRASDDLTAIMRYYAAAWHTRDVILAGYSMGASVLPAIVNRMPSAEQQNIRSVVLMAPSRATDFEFHLSGWLQRVSKHAQPVAPEIVNMPAGIRITCIYGGNEGDHSLCTQIDAARVALTLKKLPGAHHFDGDYAALARLIR